MKKTSMAVAVAAASAAGFANAQFAESDTPMYVNPDKTGQYLIYPFYTADNGNETYITVTNTTDQAKAVKVRILEAENSWEVRDFNVYLSPHDHFSFAISLDESGAGKLATADNSCTVPQLQEAPYNGEIAFTNALFDEEENGELERTINGHVEIIEMGQFGRLTGAGWVETKNDEIPALWLHGENADGEWEPADCDAVEALWTRGRNGAPSGDWYAQVSNDPDNQNKNGWEGEGSMWRGGGLYGTGEVVNPDGGWAIGYDAIAVENFVVAGTVGDESEDIGSGAHLHYYPGDTDPGLGTLRDGINASATTFANFGELGTGQLTLTSGIPALTMATMFQAEKIQNDYVLEPFFDGSTDWVVTFPTKHFHVNRTAVLAPFTNVWDGNESCDTYDIQTWDREEQTYTPPGITDKPPFSPYTEEVDDPDPIAICYETNLLTFGTQDPETGEGTFDSVFWDLTPSASSSRIHTPIGTAYNNGWAELTWNDADHFITVVAGDGPTEPGGQLDGLPAVGFAAIQFENGELDGGLLANYAAAHEHKFQKNFSAINGD